MTYGDKRDTNIRMKTVNLATIVQFLAHRGADLFDEGKEEGIETLLAAFTINDLMVALRSGETDEAAAVTDELLSSPRRANTTIACMTAALVNAQLALNEFGAILRELLGGEDAAKAFIQRRFEAKEAKGGEEKVADH